MILSYRLATPWQVLEQCSTIQALSVQPAQPYSIDRTKDGMSSCTLRELNTWRFANLKSTRVGDCSTMELFSQPIWYLDLTHYSVGAVLLVTCRNHAHKIDKYCFFRRFLQFLLNRVWIRCIRRFKVHSVAWQGLNFRVLLETEAFESFELSDFVRTFNIFTIYWIMWTSGFC
jgi:hypothetical protein